MDPCVVRSVYLFGVEGFSGRRNDVLFKPSIPGVSRAGTQQKTLVYFGGDVQNFLHLMDRTDPAIPFKSWCLETTADQLAESFPKHNIVIIKPSRTAFDHVSCYDNFVAGNILGSPKFVYCYSAIPHMEMILRKISQTIRLMPIDTLYDTFIVNEEPEAKDANAIKKKKERDEKRRQLVIKWQMGVRLNMYSLTIIGFSKGCVVLNQFLYEFHYAKRLEPKKHATNFIECIVEIYWLDSSHPGREDVYVTSSMVLKTLVELDIDIQNHVSHYQVEDLARPWIGRQWLVFTNTLAKHTAKQAIFIHKRDTADVHAHFDVLFSFMLENNRRDRLQARPLRRVPAPAPPPPPAPRTRAPRRRAAASPPPPLRDPSPARESDHDLLLYRNVLGIALINPHCNPYFGVQVILRRPVRELRALASERSTSPASPAPPASRAPPALSADAFTVIAKTRSAKIDFELDAEAAEYFREPKYYSTRTPRLAMPCDRNAKPGIQIYKPEKRMYVPTVVTRPPPAQFRGAVCGIPDSTPLMMFEVLPGFLVPRPATLASRTAHAVPAPPQEAGPSQAASSPTAMDRFSVWPQTMPRPVVFPDRPTQGRSADTPYSANGRTASNRYRLRSQN